MRRETLGVVVLGASSLALYGAVDYAERALATDMDRVAVAMHLAVYAVATLALFSAYVRVLARARQGALEDGAPRMVALFVPVTFHAAMALRMPRLSQDLFSYVAQGYLGTVPGWNPLLQPASDASLTPIAPSLAAYDWAGPVGITPYGILWTRIEMAVVHAASDVPTALHGLKAVVFAASMATAGAIWVFAGKAAPRWQMTATLAYLWNPLFVVELAGEGHNDAVMAAGVLWGLAALAARRPALGGMALLGGVFTKYVPLVFVPAQLAFAYRSRRSGRAFAWGVALAIAGGIAAAALLYAPLWAGSRSFAGLLQRADAISSASPFGALNWVLRRTPLHERAGALTFALLNAPVFVYALWRGAKVRDASEAARVCGWLALLFMLGTAPDYWPWYSTLPAALFIASGDAEGLAMAVVLTVCARLIAPLNVTFVNGVVSMKLAKGLTTGVGATLPLLVAAVRRLRVPRTTEAPVLSMRSSRP